jgi:hypothetical protein
MAKSLFNTWKNKRHIIVTCLQQFWNTVQAYFQFFCQGLIILMKNVFCSYWLYLLEFLLFSPSYAFFLSYFLSQQRDSKKKKKKENMRARACVVFILHY